jgi:concanavalin A-like lectin/glucanase superfamily protein
MAASFRPKGGAPPRRRGLARGSLSVGLLAASLGACSLGFDADDLSQGAGAGGSSGAPSSQGSGGGVGGAGRGGQGGDASGSTGGAGGTGPAGAAGAGGANAGMGGVGGVGGVQGPVVSLDGCILLLHLDEPAWADGVEGAVKDASGQANDGKAAGATPNPEGKFGGAGDFNGASQIEVPSPAPFAADATALTYAAWVYPTAEPPFEGSGIISKRKGYLDGSAFTLFLWDGAVYADINNEGRIHTAAGVTLNAWHHLAVVYDGAAKTAIIYVDGAPGVTGAVGEAIVKVVDPPPVVVGNLPGGGGHFTGRIDDVAIWTRALSQKEIETIYGAGRAL